MWTGAEAWLALWAHSYTCSAFFFVVHHHPAPPSACSILDDGFIISDIQARNRCGPAAAAAAARGRAALAHLPSTPRSHVPARPRQVEGAVLLCGDFFALWDVRSIQDVTLNSLALLELVKPAPGVRGGGGGVSGRRPGGAGWSPSQLCLPARACPGAALTPRARAQKPPPPPPHTHSHCPTDLLVLGCGARPRQLPEHLVAVLHERGVRVEATDTVCVCV